MLGGVQVVTRGIAARQGEAVLGHGLELPKQLHAPCACHGSGLGLRVLGFRLIVPLKIDRIWLWVFYNKIPIYLLFYLLKGDYRGLGLRILETGRAKYKPCFKEQTFLKRGVVAA